MVLVDIFDERAASTKQATLVAIVCLSFYFQNKVVGYAYTMITHTLLKLPYTALVQ